jgi:hypothetical protein
MPNLGLQLASTNVKGTQESVPFSPSDLNGLFEWFAADYGVLNSVDPNVSATNGQYIRRWLNKVSGGVNAEQTSASLQPNYETGSSRTSINFRGTVSTRFTIASGVVNPPLTYYAVFHNLNGVYQDVINRNTSSGRWRSAFGDTEGFPYIRQFSNSTFPSDGVASITTGNDVKMVLCGSLNGSGNGFIKRVTSSEDNEQSMSVTTGTTISITSILGSKGWDTTNTGVEKLYEFLCYNVEHEESQRNKVIAYLRSKHSI